MTLKIIYSNNHLFAYKHTVPKHFTKRHKRSKSKKAKSKSSSKDNDSKDNDRSKKMKSETDIIIVETDRGIDIDAVTFDVGVIYHFVDLSLVKCTKMIYKCRI